MVLAIVQARMSSTRLPGKVMKELFHKPMIVHQLERLQRCRHVDKIVVAMSCEQSDDVLAEKVSSFGVEVFRGSLNDVLDRYYQCAKNSQAEHIVRITGDCPLLDCHVVDQIIFEHIAAENDYTSNTIQPTYPDGLDVEVMRYDTLEIAWKEAKLPSEREHVTQYIIKHSELFKQGCVRYYKNLSMLRWTVDEPEDFYLVQCIYELLYPKNENFFMEDILQLLAERPELKKINSRFERNEGLKKSLLEDKKWKDAE